MPLTIQHSKTATTPDHTSAEIRPSHWNEAHLVSVSLAGSEVLKYIGAGASSQSSGTVQFSNSNGVSFGMSNGVITASHAALTTQSVQTQGIQSVAAGGNTVSAGGVVFSNVNGLSFGLNGSTLTGSYSTAAQSVQSLGLYASSQTTGAASSTTVDARSLTVVGAGGVSAGMSGGSLVISGASGGAADGFNRLAAGTQTAGTNTTVNFANSNGVTFGMSGSNQITASHDGLRSHLISAPNGSSSVAGVSFANSFGVSWSNSNGSIVASVATAGGGADTVTQYATGNTAGDASSGTQALTSLVVRGAGIASVGYSNDGALIVSVPAGGGGGDGGNVLIAGTQTATSLGSVLFENSNGITFGMSGSTRITASHDGLTTAAQSNHSHGNPTLALTNLTGTTASASNGLTLSLSAAAPQTVASIYAVSNTTQSSSMTAPLSALSFHGAGAASIGASNGSVVVSVAAGAQSNQTMGLYASSNTTVNSSSTIDARSLSVRAIGAISAGLSAGELVLSVSPGAQSNQTAGIYAVGNTTGQSSSSTYDARTLSVDGAGIVSAGWSNGTLRISATQSAQTIGVYASFFTTGQSTSSVVDARSLTLVGRGIVSVGWSNDAFLISASQSNQAFSAQGGSSAFQTLGFSNGNGATFTNTNGSVGLSYTVPTQVSAFAQSNTTQSSSATIPLNSLQFAGAGAASVGISNGSVVISAPSPGAASLTISAVGNTTVNSSGTWPNALSLRAYGILSAGTSNGSLLLSTPDAVDFTQLSVGFSTGGNTAGDTGLATGRVVLVGTNNITLSGSTNGGSMTISISGGAGGGAAVTASADNGSYTVGTLSFSNANGVSFGTSAGSAITASVAAQSVQSLGLYASSFTTGQSTSSTYDARSLSIVGAGIVSLGWSNGSFRISAAQSAQTAGLYGVGNTTQNSSTTLDARTVSFNGLGAMSVGFSNGSVQLSVPATSSLSATGQVSISTNGGTISIGVPNPSTETNGFFPFAGIEMMTAQIGQASLIFDPQTFPNVSFDRLQVPIFNSNSSNSSGSHTLSFWFGLYSRNASTLSLVGSTSFTTALTQSGTVGSYSLFSGMRHVTFGSSTSLSAGKYWMAFASRTTSGGADGSYSNFVLSQIATNFLGVFGQSANASRHFTLGQGFYSASTSGIPSSVAFSDIQGSLSQGQRMQIMMFGNSTV